MIPVHGKKGILPAVRIKDDIIEGNDPRKLGTNISSEDKLVRFQMSRIHNFDNPLVPDISLVSFYSPQLLINLTRSEIKR